MNGFQRVCGLFCTVYVVHGFKTRADITQVFNKCADPQSATRGKNGDKWVEGLREWRSLRNTVDSLFEHTFEARPDMRPSEFAVTTGLQKIFDEVQQLTKNKLRIERLETLYKTSGFEDARQVTPEQNAKMVETMIGTFAVNEEVKAFVRTNTPKTPGGGVGAPAAAQPKAHAAAKGPGKGKKKGKKEGTEGTEEEKPPKTPKKPPTKEESKLQGLRDQARHAYASSIGKTMKEVTVEEALASHDGRYDLHAWVAYNKELKQGTKSQKSAVRQALVTKGAEQAAKGGKGKPKGKGKGGDNGGKGGGGKSGQNPDYRDKPLLLCVQYMSEGWCSRGANCPYPHRAPNLEAWAKVSPSAPPAPQAAAAAAPAQQTWVPGHWLPSANAEGRQ